MPMQVFISLIIIAASGVLFAYWFRYSCLLILSTHTTQDYTSVVARASGLGVLELQARLEAGEINNLDAILRAMNMDYERVKRLLAKAPGVQHHLPTTEQLLLRADYQLMRMCALFAGRRNPLAAREALLEQCAILSHFANAAGCAGVLRG